MWKFLSGILVFISACSQDNSKLSTENLALFGFRSSRITIEGSAIKGLVKNAVVNITPLNTDGTCNTNTVLASGTTDSFGAYSLIYTKTGSNVCLIVTKNPNGKSSVYDEKLGADVLLGASSKFQMQTVIQEKKITGNKKDSLVSPFSRMLFSRLKVLAKQAGSSADMSKLIPQASKEIVIRFGLNKGFSSSKAAALSERAVNDKDYPELDDVIIELQNPTSPVTMKFLSVLTGFSYLANKHKKGTSLSIDDIDDIIDALADDFSDGIFDGVNSSGTAVTIGPSKTPLGNNSLTGIFLPAVNAYFSEGGTLYFGQNASAPNISVTQYLSEIAFADTVSIITGSSSASAAPTVVFGGNAFSFPLNIAVSVAPTVIGTLTGCTISPALPAGLSLNSLTCAITGTPTAAQGPTAYTISAVSAGGTGTTAISIKVGTTTATVVYGQLGSLTSNTFNNGGLSANSLYASASIAFDSSGNAYIADYSNNRVLYYPAGSTTATRVYGQAGSFTTATANNGGVTANSIAGPFGVAVGPTGNLFIVDYTNNRVLGYTGASTTATAVYGQAGIFTTGTANNGGITANSIAGPFGAAVDSAGNLYVAEITNNRVLYYPAGSTTATRVYGQLGSFTTNTANNGGISANSLSGPQRVNVDSTGVYIADSANHRVLYYPGTSTTATRVYGQAGSFTTATVNNGGVSANSLNNPAGIAIDAAGNVYIGEDSNYRVMMYPGTSTTGVVVYGQLGSFASNTFNNGGVSANSLNTVKGVSINPLNGTVHIVDYGNQRVLGY